MGPAPGKVPVCDKPMACDVNGFIQRRFMKTELKNVRHGTFLLLKGDMVCEYLENYGEWSETEVDLYREVLSESSNVIEVGTHIGSHTVPISKICSEGKIVTYEAQRVMHAMLSANLMLNCRTNVIAKHACGWNENTVLELETCNYDDSWNYGNFSVEKGYSFENQFAGETSKDFVPAYRIDDDPHVAVLPTVDFIKLDAEGAELRVLEGAMATIRKHKPVVYVEAVDLGIPKAVREVLEPLGYKGYWFFSLRGRPDSFFGPVNYRDKRSTRMEENSVFVHESSKWVPRGLREIDSTVVPPPDTPAMHRYPMPEGRPPLFTVGKKA